MKKLNTQLTPEEALRLADRYFEAQTSEEEGNDSETSF